MSNENDFVRDELKRREGMGGFSRYFNLEPFDNGSGVFGNFKDLNFVTESLGTNNGGVAVDSISGEILYAKEYRDAAQAGCEFIANRIYALMGVPVLRGVLIKNDERYAYATPYDQNLTKLPANRRKEVSSYLLVAAYLKDYDMVGIGPENPYGNLLQNKEGKIIILDHGAALLFRGLTGRKSKSWIEEQNVETVDLMRDPDVQYGKFKRSADVFGDVTDFELRSQAEAILKTITSAIIYEIVDASGLNENDKKVVIKILLDGLVAIRKRFLETEA